MTPTETNDTRCSAHEACDIFYYSEDIISCKSPVKHYYLQIGTYKLVRCCANHAITQLAPGKNWEEISYDKYLVRAIMQS
jgi:hypothetical protein